MATFPSISPDYGVNKKSEPNVRKVQFADGYEQRILFGLPAHQDPKVWNLTFKNITESESDTIEAFLEARVLDSASFTWTPPGSSSSYKWVCDSWDKSINYANLATINTTFREVFEV